MQHRARIRRYLIGLWLALGLLSFLPDAAYAQANGNYGSFSCSAGQSVGTLYNSGASCPTTISSDHIFSFFICNMERLSSDLMGNMYCGMMNDLIPAVLGVLTLAVLFFGFSFTVGLIPATARDFQVFLLKMSFIAAFATQSDLLISYGYQFLVSGLREGVAVALSGLDVSPGAHLADGAQVYGYLDGFLEKIIGFATDYMGIDRSDPSKAGDFCKNALFAVLAVMSVAFPPLFYMGLLIIVKITLTFLRAVFGYMYSIVGIAFLLTLAPFFLSFYLFQKTRPFFDKWLAYLVSFALQMVILFSFLVFILSIDITHISSSITSLIYYDSKPIETKTMRLPWEYCTICEFEAVSVSTGAVIADSDYKNFMGESKLQCKTPLKKISPLFMTSADAGSAATKKVENTLFKFTTSFISLFVLAYIVDALLRYAASLAQFLAGSLGASYAPQLGGGWSPRRFTTDLPGFGEGGVGERFADEFNKGFQHPDDKKQDSVQRTMAGLKQASTDFISGTPDGKNGGLKNNFIDYLTDPNRIDIR